MTHDTSTRPPTADPGPSRVRHLVVGVCVLMSVLLYLDRICVSIAGNYIQEDLRLSPIQMGLFFSAFFWTYALAQVPSGWLSDRFGARAMLSVYILSWSAFTAVIGLAHSFTIMLIMRAAFGFAQAGAYPTSAAILSRWAPFSSRGSASALVAFGGRVGGALAPLLTAALIVMFVPVEVSSLFPGNGLRDAAALGRQLADAEPSPGQAAHPAGTAEPAQPQVSQQVLTKIWQSETEPGRAELHRIVHQLAASDTFDDATGNHTGKKPDAANDADTSPANDAVSNSVAAPSSPPLSDADQNRLIAALNTAVTREDFWQAKWIHELKLPQEAVQIAAVAPEDRSSFQTQRLNRLTIEAVCAGNVCQLYRKGWRPVMVAYGVAGMFVALLFWSVFRERPTMHPWCNTAEQELIGAGLPVTPPTAGHSSAGTAAGSPAAKTTAFPWRPLLTSPSMWLMSVSQFGTNIGWVFLITLFPQYLSDVHRVPLDRQSQMQSLTLMIGMAGMLAGGRLTDRLVHRVGLKWGRSLPILATRLLAAAAYLACLWLGSPWEITIALAAMAFFTDLGVAASWAYLQDVGGQYVGATLGWANMWGNFGAAVAPPLVAVVLSAYGWNAVFCMSAGAFIVSGLAAVGIDATRPLAAE